MPKVYDNKVISHSQSRREFTIGQVRLCGNRPIQALPQRCFQRRARPDLKLSRSRLVSLETSKMPGLSL